MRPRRGAVSETGAAQETRSQSGDAEARDSRATKLEQSQGPSAHGPDCTLGTDGGPCVRCAGFQPGNEHGLKGGRPVEHGAYAVLHLTPRAGEIAAWIRSQVEHLTMGDEAAVQTLALTLAQLERAAGVLGEVDEAIVRGDDVDVYLGRIESRARLSQDARRWADSARRFMDDLGLTPAGRAALAAAQQPPGLPAHEVQALFSAFVRATLEFVDRVRRDEFMARINAVSQPIIGELPPAGETTDADKSEKSA